MYIVAAVVLLVIILQVRSFLSNRKAMKKFGNIFLDDTSWGIENDSYGLVSGISGKGNDVFNTIKDNINKYLGNSKGAVIDYNILKDSVDRNVETIEDQINAQMPVPLYFGLAGTMAGVIVGLTSLLLEGSISSLMGSGSQNAGAAAVAMSGAANGINDLLAGVALAMVASILGIILTTWNSVKFKKYKNLEEDGKNNFLSWMQSVLLPKLPNDISDAFTKLVDNLNRFNGTFRENTRGLGATLDKINKSYSIQADIVKTIQNMDVEKMAQANIHVLKALNESTNKLAVFNLYLDSVKGYTTEIESFRHQLQSEGNEVELMRRMIDTTEGIRNFFYEETSQITHRKQVVAQAVDSLDNSLEEALKNLSKASKNQIDDIKNGILEQTDGLQKSLAEEEKMLKDMIETVRQDFQKKLSDIPSLAERLQNIADIPVHLKALSDQINESNTKLVKGIDQSNRKMVQELQMSMKGAAQWNKRSEKVVAGGTTKVVMPTWLKASIVTLLVIIAGASAATTYITYTKPVTVIKKYVVPSPPKRNVSAQNHSLEEPTSNRNVVVPSNIKQIKKEI